MHITGTIWAPGMAEKHWGVGGSSWGKKQDVFFSSVFLIRCQHDVKLHNTSQMFTQQMF